MGKRQYDRRRVDRTQQVGNCKRCGKSFIQPQIGAPKTYCSQDCSFRTNYAKRKAILITKSCQVCAGIFVTKLDSKRITCSRFCYEFRRERWPKRARRKPSQPHPEGKTCIKCDRPAWALDLCLAHYTRSKRRSGRAGISGHKKRAEGYGVAYEPGITMLEIGERSNWMCSICGGEVDQRIIKGAWGKSIDHIIPMAKGGGHVRGNVALSHHLCNSLKAHH